MVCSLGPMLSNVVKSVRIGVVGFGSVGKYLTGHILSDHGRAAGLELAFVWDITPDHIREADPSIREYQLVDINDFSCKGADMIIEVAHPSITRDYGTKFLSCTDYLAGSPTCFADAAVEAAIRKQVANSGYSLYLPAGALWGANDIQKMASQNSISNMTITMKKNSHHLKVLGNLKTALDKIVANDLPGEHVLYEGPVGPLCPLAPNNVNTMACAAMAGGLGFHNTKARLVVDRSLDAHVVEVDIEGPDGFIVKSSRYNPAKEGAVTGNATYASFLNSLLAATGITRGRMHSGTRGDVHIL